MDFSGFRAMTFDCYGTLIDWELGILENILPRLEQFHPDVESDLALSAIAAVQALRQKIRPAEAYPHLLSRCYAVLEDSLGIPADGDAQREFGDSIGRWPPFADTLRALQYLQKHFRLGILSNVDSASLQRTIGLLEARIDVSVTADDVGSYKPGLPHFHEAFKRFEEVGIKKAEILHVAQSKRHDIEPAKRVDLSSVWINRRHDRSGNGMAIDADVNPAATFNSLAELVHAHEKHANQN
jgi:2-haloacid dehalogenase